MIYLEEFMHSSKLNVFLFSFKANLNLDYFPFHPLEGSIIWKLKKIVFKCILVLDRKKNKKTLADWSSSEMASETNGVSWLKNFPTLRCIFKYEFPNFRPKHILIKISKSHFIGTSGLRKLIPVQKLCEFVVKLLFAENFTKFSPWSRLLADDTQNLCFKTSHKLFFDV